MKLFFPLLVAFSILTGAWADPVPCVAQDAATLAGTTCSIADKSFSFGSLYNGVSIPIGFVPDVGDSGFTLSGYTAVSQSTNLVVYVLPFTVETLNGNPTINGLATQILDPVLAGSGPGNCNRPGCHITNSPYVQSYFGPSGFPFDEYHLDNGTMAEQVDSPLSVTPTNSLSILADAEIAGDLASFSRAHYEILQSVSSSAVPEPTTIFLLASGLVAIGIRKRVEPKLQK